LLIETRKDSSNGHRGRLDIIADILEASHAGTKKTYLMYRCNLSFRQLRDYLDFMLRRGFLWNNNGDGHSEPTLFKTTAKGKEFLKAYKNLKALMK
jgi:predicted transcriptional regulator